MLAPRKTLWSTPQSAIDVALSFADLRDDDVVYDVGCGDARVLIQMASKSIPQSHKTTKHTTGNTSNQYHHCHTFIGIEISPERAQEARANILQGQTSGLIPSHVTMEIRCENALELNYDEATVVFLYLVPRGLRLIQPILWGGERDVDSKHELMSTNNETVEQTNHGTSEIPQEQTRIPKRIISYMNPIENKTFIKREYCKVGNVEGAAFPIYLYHS